MIGIPIVAFVKVEDFHEAAADAGVSICASDEVLADATVVAAKAAWSVVAGQLSPSIPDLRANAKEQEETANFCSALLERLTRDLRSPPVAPELEGHVELRRRIVASTQPYYFNLLNADPADSEAIDPAGTLAEEILAVARLEGRARAAYAAGESGIKGYREASKDPFERSRARDLGLTLIESYVELTGLPVVVSRRPEDERLDGPLIRFLRSMFRRIGEAVARNEPTRALAQEKAWTPSDETFRKWSKEVRKGDPATLV
jgi:hypothetical protein